MLTCKDLSIFILVASVFLGDGGGPSDSSSESLPYGEDVFLGIGTGSVYCVTVALTATYLACMFILYNKFGVGNCHASPSSRHS
jgi:hypothetical protein